MRLRWELLGVWGLLLVLCVATARGADNPPPANDRPTILMTQPLGAAIGGATRMTIRGLKLEQATAVKSTTAGVTAKIVGQGAAPLPKNIPTSRCGDQQVEIELHVPANTPAGMISIIVTAKTGESAPRDVAVLSAESLVNDQEPNDGFKQAQPLDAARTAVGHIHQNQNVDVYRYAGTAGEKVTIDLQAARAGSALDGMLTLFDAQGRILAACDDTPGMTDPTIEATLPAAGVYYVSVGDAHDLGGSSHPYRLTIRRR